MDDVVVIVITLNLILGLWIIGLFQLRHQGRGTGLAASPRLASTTGNLSAPLPVRFLKMQMNSRASQMRATAVLSVSRLCRRYSPVHCVASVLKDGRGETSQIKESSYLCSGCKTPLILSDVGAEARPGRLYLGPNPHSLFYRTSFQGERGVVSDSVSIYLLEKALGDEQIGLISLIVVSPWCRSTFFLKENHC